MLIFNGILFIIFLVIYIISRLDPASLEEVSSKIKGKDKQEHKLYFLYPMASVILKVSIIQKWIDQRRDIEDQLKTLHIGEKVEEVKAQFWHQKISYLLVIVFLCNLFSFFYQIQTLGKSPVFEHNLIQRPNYGESTKEVDLSYTMVKPKLETENERNHEEKGYERDIKLRIIEKEYTLEEWNDLLTQVRQYLDHQVLGNNESVEEIYYDLDFCTQIPGTNLSIEWKPENYNLIDSKGHVKNEEMEQSEYITSVTAKITHQGNHAEYEIPLRILPRIYSKEDQLSEALQEELYLSHEESKDKDYIELPREVEGYQIQWREKKNYTGIQMICFGFIVALLLWNYQDFELSKKIKKRKEEMIRDYPEIINKFTLLVGAGMTLKQTWSKITTEYVKKRKKQQMPRRFAYEEMLVTYHELNVGITESRAYEQFGRRVGLLPYLKFSTLISQNLRKGNKGLLELLQREAMEAYGERKEIAKRLGEQAGTKLLAPMMLMLVVVMLIILIPAFLSFG